MARFARLAAIIVLGWLFCGTVAVADTLTLQGSTTFNSELVVGKLASVEAAARHRIVVVPNKSSIGLFALLDGKADLAMISTALANEVDTVLRLSPNAPIDRLRVFRVSMTQAAFVVHPSNPVGSITREMLVGVLNGQITNWTDLGGPALPIRLVSVHEGGGVLASVEGATLGAGRRVTAPNRIQVRNGTQVLGVVEQEVGALGITQSKLANGRPVRMLSVGAPIVQELSLVSLGEPSPAMLDVIAAFRDAATTSPME